MIISNISKGILTILQYGDMFVGICYGYWLAIFLDKTTAMVHAKYLPVLVDLDKVNLYN